MLNVPVRYIEDSSLRMTFWTEEEDTADNIKVRGILGFSFKRHRIKVHSDIVKWVQVFFLPLGD